MHCLEHALGARRLICYTTTNRLTKCRLVYNELELKQLIVYAMKFIIYLSNMSSLLSRAYVDFTIGYSSLNSSSGKL